VSTAQVLVASYLLLLAVGIVALVSDRRNR
jgi:hypothetical protein